MVIAIERPQGDHADDQPATTPTSTTQGTSPPASAIASDAAAAVAAPAIAYGSTARSRSRWPRLATSCSVDVAIGRYEQNHRRHLIQYPQQSLHDPFVYVWCRQQLGAPLMHWQLPPLLHPPQQSA